LQNLVGSNIVGQHGVPVSASSNNVNENINVPVQQSTSTALVPYAVSVATDRKISIPRIARQIIPSYQYAVLPHQTVYSGDAPAQVPETGFILARKNGLLFSSAVQDAVERKAAESQRIDEILKARAAQRIGLPPVFPLPDFELEVPGLDSVPVGSDAEAPSEMDKLCAVFQAFDLSPVESGIQKRQIEAPKTPYAIKKKDSVKAYTGGKFVVSLNCRDIVIPSYLGKNPRDEAPGNAPGNAAKKLRKKMPRWSPETAPNRAIFSL
jgi:hypothetical protein